MNTNQDYIHTRFTFYQGKTNIEEYRNLEKITTHFGLWSDEECEALWKTMSESEKAPYVRRAQVEIENYIRVSNDTKYSC